MIIDGTTLKNCPDCRYIKCECPKTFGKVSKEFPKGKESYCPRCYFEEDKTILRKDCPHYLS